MTVEAPVLDAVIADLVARAELGNEKFGGPMRPFDGRDALREAYEESLDLTMYLRKELLERDLAVRAALPHRACTDGAERRRQELTIVVKTPGFVPEFVAAALKRCLSRLSA